MAHNHMLDCPPDDRCVHCGQQLPDYCPTGSYEWNGYCDAQCTIMALLARLGVAPGLEPEPDHPLSKDERTLLLRAVIQPREI
jgi:hypothetical protein